MNATHTLLAGLVALFLLSCERTTNNYYYDTDEDTAANATAGTTGGDGSTGGGSGSGSGDSGDDSSNDDDDGDDDGGGNFDDDGSAYGDEGDDGSEAVTIEGVLSVAQALRQNYGVNVEVVGYVVGASKTNVKNTVFAAPFPSSANIVLADRPYQGEAIPADELLQVKLTDNSSKGFRSQVNLADHPGRQNKRVLVSGTLEAYYKRIALVRVWQIQDLD